ncbi:peptidoglycan recognition family protein [Chroococcidiopsis sp. CCNUC1]|uniref:peptidoglycan recognition protein family protein n=1 Tax=Chroococcidiopsis sp. CCNUC1 TaxID=2653189 RepID=UPI002022663E|nr:peptidoglycan recognition family protein [Chroococcidiopsis sp. CCNUC1]URD52945.1 peptidoglycan recognition protein family protein [Chroococcidiopsis sp. CCNUC1]
MEIRVWKTRALLIFVLSLCVAVALALFPQTPELQQIDASVLPAVPVSYEETVVPAPEAPQQQKPQKVDNSSQESRVANATTATRYKPRYQIAWAHPLNYGDRFATDIYGKPVYNQPIIVLHETVYSAASAINTFRTPHQQDDKQVSYHTLIGLDGTVIYIVPPEKRAFGAANSVFIGSNGAETVKTHPNLASSVNNFAYHVSLETPVDGRDRDRRHSGYTQAQYKSLAWLIAQSKVPDARITTHKAVDRSGSRSDPRSFDRRKFLSLLHAYRGISRKS